MVFSFPALALAADPFDHWQQRYPPYPIVDFNAITFADGHFIVVGNSGTILAGSNRDWTVRASNTTNHLFGVAYGNGRFVAVGERGRVITSMGGLNWTSLQIDPSLDLRAVTFGQNFFVAISRANANTNQIWTSSDGITWTSRPYYTASGGAGALALSSATYGGGLFVVGGGRTFYSSNATEWYEGSVTNTFGFPVQSVTYGNGLFVAHSRYSSALSRDAKNWWPAEAQFAQDKHAAAFGGSHYVWVGEGAHYQWSSNGTNWLGGRIFYTGTLRGVAYGHDRYIAVGDGGGLYHSLDATNWSQVLPGPTGYTTMSDFDYAAGKYVSVHQYDGVIMVSSNLVEWQRSDPPSPLIQITHYAGKFVGVGPGGAIATSQDALLWTPVESPVKSNLLSIASSSNLLVAVGNGGTVLTSPDGTNWVGGPVPGVDGHVSAVVRGDDRFVAVSDAGYVIRSFDGLSWDYNIAWPSRPRFAGLAFGKCLYAAFAGQSIYVSTNGLDWVYAQSSDTLTLYSVGYGDGRFVACGYNSYPFPYGCLLTSSNGLRWTCHRMPSYRYSDRPLFAEGSLIIRWNDRLLQSDPISSPTLGFVMSVRRGTAPEISVAGSANTCCRLESVTALGPETLWQPTGYLILNTNGIAGWTDSEFTNKPARFFRSVGVP